MSKFEKLKGQQLTQNKLGTIQGGNLSTTLQCKHPFINVCIPARYLGGSCPANCRKCGF